jgi:hypothetical protein
MGVDLNALRGAALPRVSDWESSAMPEMLGHLTGVANHRISEL